MKFLLASVFIFLVSPLQAAQFSCEADEVKADYHTFIQYGPDFFTKSVPIPQKDKATHFRGFVAADEDLATYIADSGGDNNRIVRLKRDEPAGTGKKSIEYEVPGPYDPVPSPDGRILSVASPMRLYDIREFLVKDHRPEPLNNGLIGGVYQSIAWLRDEPLRNALQDKYNNRVLADNERIYRIITDNDYEVAMVDFLITYDDSCDVKTAVDSGKHCVEIEVLKPEGAATAEAWNHCGEKSLKTLFISKRGTYLSGYERTDHGGVTKIIDITKGGGSCPEVMNFGYPTGKVDFNDNEDKVTFHVDFLSDHSGSYFSKVDGFTTKDVFVMDLAEDTPGKLKGTNLRRISTTLGRGRGCYYPSFFNDQEMVGGVPRERVLCMFDEGNELDPNDGYNFRTYDVTTLETETGDFLPKLDGMATSLTPEELLRLHNASLIGLVWGKACNPADNDEYTGVQAAGLFLNLKHEDCKVIADLWGEPNTTDQNILDFRKRLSEDRRFEDDPRFGDPSYIMSNISKDSLMKSCAVAEKYQSHLRTIKAGITTETFGSANAGVFIQLSGYEIAQRKCTGCHHYDVPLNAALEGDLAQGISSFPNVFEFGGWHEVPLMYIDASLERIGYDPLARGGSSSPQLVDDILDYLGRDIVTSREMPPRQRVQLRSEPNYNEREILGRHLYEMRKERVEAIQSLAN